MTSELASQHGWGWWRKLTTVDKATLGYHFGILLVPGMVSLYRGLSLLTFLFNVAAILFVLGLRTFATPSPRPKLPSQRIRHHFLCFIANFYPLFFFLPIYEQVGTINRILVKQDLDPLLQNLDQTLFGRQPALVLSKAFQPPWFSEYMHFSYFNFYWMFALLGIILAYRYPHQQFSRFLTALCLSFYTCNFLFVFLPALGPVTLPGMIFPTGGWIFTPLMKLIYQFEIPGGAFPSSHVALTTVTLYYSRLLKSGRSLYWILGLSLIFSTVYCGYHYVVDVFGGLMVAAIVIAITEIRSSR